jgi:hypothetical protein
VCCVSNSISFRDTVDLIAASSVLRFHVFPSIESNPKLQQHHDLTQNTGYTLLEDKCLSYFDPDL